MRHPSLVLCGVLAGAAACGPKLENPGDTDTDPTSTSDAPGTTDVPDPTTSQPEPTTDPPTTGDTTTGDTTTGDTTTGDTTTGAPVECPEGLAKWEKIGGAALVLPPGTSNLRQMAPMIDGSVAMALMVTEGDRTAPGLLKVTRTGEVVGLETGEFGEPQFQIVSRALRRADDGRLILSQASILGQERVQGISTFAADAAPIGSVALPGSFTDGFAVLGDDVVLSGVTTGQPLPWARRVSTVDGAQAWQTDLAGAESLGIQRITTSSTGDVLMAGPMATPGPHFTEVHVWRLDPGGALVWHRAIEVAPVDMLHDLVVGPDGQVFVLRFGPWPDGKADLLALELATGATLWDVTVADIDADLGFAQVYRIHVDADALTIPVARGEPELLTLTSAGVQRVSFTGELQEFVPLDVPAGEEFSIDSARGACGELLIWTGFENHWLGSFAP